MISLQKSQKDKKTRAEDKMQGKCSLRERRQSGMGLQSHSADRQIYESTSELGGVAEGG